MAGRKMLIIALIFSVIGIVTRAQNTDGAIITEDYEIEMDAWTSAAQLTLPADADEGLPLVILFHGSGPYDMNASYASDLSTEPISQNFLTIAETLAGEGIAVLRFNKRGVIDYGDYDFAQVQSSTLDVLVADANAVVDFALDLPQIDTEQIYLYGWSEGAWVIANVATMRDDIAGLIMQGAPNGSLVDTIPYQYQELAPDYLRNDVDTDGDGLLSLDDIADIPFGPVQYMVPFFFYDQASDPANPTINSFVDQNSDGLISIDDELIPMIDMYLGNLPAYLPPVEASYDTAAMVAEVNIPTLLLHGAKDGWTALSGAETIQEAAPDTVTLSVYPELGHALSITEKPAEDGFYPMEQEPLDDLIDWLAAQ